ncbi:MAG: PfkB family carbohydrate kinase [Patescibacteria group bacterium]|nr:PfkB family carbohydrate kinase [Patescibacteria group bacterium]
MRDVVVGFSLNPEIYWTGIPVQSGMLAGQKVSAQASWSVSGTSFDVAWALLQSGCTPLLLGAVGADDPLNRVIEQRLGEINMPHQLLGVREHTCLASIEPEHERHLSFKSPVVTVDTAAIKLVIEQEQPKFRVVTGLMPDENEIVLAQTLLAPNGGIRILNPRQALTGNRPVFKEIVQSADWLFMNRFEAAEFLEVGSGDLQLSMLEQFLELGPSLVVVTMDGDGSFALSREGLTVSMPSHIHGPKVDEKGAGDCLLGFFIAATLKGCSPEDALRMATVAAGIKVTRMGTTNIPSMAEVMEVVSHYEV